MTKKIHTNEHLQLNLIEIWMNWTKIKLYLERLVLLTNSQAYFQVGFMRQKDNASCECARDGGSNQASIQ